MWTNKQHVMSRLAKRGHKIMYVDPLIRIRMLASNMVFKRRYSPKRLFTFKKEVENNLTVLSPVKFLFSKERERRFNLKLINRTISQSAINKPILWVYDPDFADYVEQIPHQLLIYDCVDDYSNMPQERYPDNKKAEIIEKEKKLIKRADLVFATSPFLYKLRKEQNPNTYYTPNVADFEHNSQALKETLAVPEEIKDLAKPIIGFQGNLSAYKFDFDLLEAVIASHPEWSFVFIGPVETSKTLTDTSRNTQVAKLEKHENTHFLGVQPYERLPAFYKAFDVAIMPNKQNDYNRSSFPLKFFEFLGAGLPVVMTKLPALAEFYNTSGVYVSVSVQDFIRNLEEAVTKGRAFSQEDRLVLAKQYSWESKIDTMIALIEERLNK